jgi:hypothetical protein
MYADQCRGADNPPRPLGAVEVAGGCSEGNVGYLETEQLTDPATHPVEPPTTELGSRPDEGHLRPTDTPAGMLRPFDHLPEQV